MPFSFFKCLLLDFSGFQKCFNCIFWCSARPPAGRRPPLPARRWPLAGPLPPGRPLPAGRRLRPHGPMGPWAIGQCATFLAQWDPCNFKESSRSCPYSTLIATKSCKTEGNKSNQGPPQKTHKYIGGLKSAKQAAELPA